MTEKLLENIEQEYNLDYEMREHRPGAKSYIFKNVVVVIDTSGRNFKIYPELLFGTYDDSLDDVEVLRKPQMKREGVDMEYVSACVHKVSEDTGIKEFQFSPYGNDGHEYARLRLFKRYFNIERSPDDHGFIVKL
jgi:hypothetical protein